MDLGAILGIIVTTVGSVAASSWLLANKIASVQSTIMEATHALDRRVTAVEAARATEQVQDRVTQIEKRLGRVELLRCEDCPARRG